MGGIIGPRSRRSQRKRRRGAQPTADDLGDAQNPLDALPALFQNMFRQIAQLVEHAERDREAQVRLDRRLEAIEARTERVSEAVQALEAMNAERFRALEERLIARFQTSEDRVAQQVENYARDRREIPVLEETFSRMAMDDPESDDDG